MRPAAVRLTALVALVCSTVAWVCVGASGSWASRIARASDPTLVDPNGQRFGVHVRSPFAAGGPGALLTVGLTNPTSTTEHVAIKDSTLAVFALVPAADRARFTDGLDRVGDYGRLVCAGRRFGNGYRNPIPRGSCALALDVVPDPDVPTTPDGQTAVLAPGANANFVAGTDAPPDLPLAHVRRVVVGFAPYRRHVAVTVPASSLTSEPPPPHPADAPSGTSRCTAMHARFHGRRVTTRPGDRLQDATLAAGGPARQLALTATFDGGLERGPIEPRYELDLTLTQGGSTVATLGATFRRGQDPAATARDVMASAPLPSDVAVRGRRLVLRTPLGALSNLHRHYRWRLAETVFEGPRQTQAFTIACGPATT